MAGRPRIKFHPKTPLLNRLRESVAGDNNSDICEKTGINADRVSRYMSGETPPTADFLASLVGAYRVDAQWLLTGERVSSSSRTPALPPPGQLETLISANEKFCALVGMMHRMHAVFLQHPEAVSGWTSMITDCAVPFEKTLEGLDQYISDVQRSEASPKALAELFPRTHNQKMA